MKNFNSEYKYIGDELFLFEKAVNWKKYFSKKICKYISGDVLEVGAGIGANTKFLSSNMNAISSWCCLEPDNKLIEEIEKNIEGLNIKSKKIVNGTIKDTSDQKFDTIVYIDVLEHIEDSSRELEQVKKRLRPNGHLIILVPAYNFLFSEFDKKIGHYRRYNKKLILKELKDNKGVENLFYLDSFGVIASILNKYFLKKELPTLSNVQFWDKYLVVLSKISDRIVFNRFGKSLVCIYKNEK